MLIKKDDIKYGKINLYKLQDEKIVIPIYQRFYDWREKEITQIIKDLESMLNKNGTDLYLLDFICYKNEYEDNNDDKTIEIADGQQRLITINNLIKAIKQFSKDNNIEIDEIKLFDITYRIQNYNEKYKKHFDNENPYSNFKKTYLKFYQFCKDHQTKLNDLIHIIKENIYIYIKYCANSNDAFEIFQQINTGGKPLSKQEIITTTIKQYCEIYNIKNNIKKDKDIERYLSSYYKYYTDNFNTNFNAIEIMSFFNKKVTNNKQSFEDFINAIELMNNYSSHPIREVISNINRKSILDILNICAIKGINIDKNRDYLEKIIIPLCMMSIFLSLNGGTPTDFRYLLEDVIKDIKNDKKPDEIRYKITLKANNSPDMYKLDKQGLLEKMQNKVDSSFKSANFKKGIFLIDNILHNKSGSIKIDCINLEHIFPQNPNGDWAQNGWPTDSQTKNTYIHSIGNCFLINEKFNKKIQNKYITEKNNQYDKSLVKDKLLQTAMNSPDFNKFENDKTNYIDDRTENILNIIYDDFPLGKVLISN